MIFSKEKEFSGHAGAVYAVSFDDRYIYSGSADKYVARWDLETGTQDKFAIKFDFPVYTVAVCEHNLYVGLNNGHLHIFDLKEKKELKFFTQHKSGVFCIAFNAHKNHVYTADADGNIAVWDNRNLSLLIYLPLNCGKIRNIDTSPGGEQFVVGGQDGSLRTFDAITFNELETWKGHENGTTAVLFHPTDRFRIISGGKDALLKEWEKGRKVALKSIPAHNYAIYKLIALNSDLIVSASRDKSIKVWSSELEFIEKKDLKEGGHKHSVNDLVAIDEHRFASCSDDGKIIVWNRGI